MAKDSLEIIHNFIKSENHEIDVNNQLYLIKYNQIFSFIGFYRSNIDER